MLQSQPSVPLTPSARTAITLPGAGAGILAEAVVTTRLRSAPPAAGVQRTR